MKKITKPSFRLFTQIDSNPKVAKGSERSDNYIGIVLHLAPHNRSGHNVCAEARECIDGCLNVAGRGRFDSVQEARIRRTKIFFDNRDEFVRLLYRDISKAYKYATDLGKKLSVRLNGTSDLSWENILPWMFSEFPGIQFHDYTKIRARYRKFLDGKFPSNYYLTFSLQPSNMHDAHNFVQQGGTAAVVFRSKELPAYYAGFPVWNGDQDDFRFLDPRGHWVGLYAKGRAKHDTSGFVIDV